MRQIDTYIRLKEGEQKTINLPGGKIWVLEGEIMLNGNIVENGDSITMGTYTLEVIRTATFYIYEE